MLELLATKRLDEISNLELKGGVVLPQSLKNSFNNILSQIAIKLNNIFVDDRHNGHRHILKVKILKNGKYLLTFLDYEEFINENLSELIISLETWSYRIKNLRDEDRGSFRAERPNLVDKIERYELIKAEPLEIKEFKINKYLEDARDKSPQEVEDYKIRVELVAMRYWIINKKQQEIGQRVKSDNGKSENSKNYKGQILYDSRTGKIQYIEWNIRKRVNNYPSIDILITIVDHLTSIPIIEGNDNLLQSLAEVEKTIFEIVKNDKWKEQNPQEV